MWGPQIAKKYNDGEAAEPRFSLASGPIWSSSRGSGSWLGSGQGSDSGVSLRPYLDLSRKCYLACKCDPPNPPKILWTESKGSSVYVQVLGVLAMGWG